MLLMLKVETIEERSGLFFSGIPSLIKFSQTILLEFVGKLYKTSTHTHTLRMLALFQSI
jgi:hypothetical protein